MLVEICANSIHSATEALKGGAQRVELCQDLENGGTTPSPGTIKISTAYLQKNGMEVFVLIRPRAGDFFYSEPEFEVMKRDILFCKENKVDGVVIGLLTQARTIDLKRTKQLLELAQPMQVTFHRAFDFVIDPLTALEQIIDLGIQRILTSGQRSTVMQGIDLIQKLVKIAGDRIIIMPGGGINSGNIEALAKLSNAREFHLSAKKRISNYNNFSGVENLEGDYFLTDWEEVKKVVRILRRNGGQDLVP